MNPFTVVSHISGNSKQNVGHKNSKYKTPEVVAVFVLIGIYVIIRLIETYVIPLIPEIITREIFSLVRLGPILIPIIFGVTHFSKKKCENTKDSYENVLKDRMMAWTK